MGERKGGELEVARVRWVGELAGESVCAGVCVCVYRTCSMSISKLGVNGQPPTLSGAMPIVMAPPVLAWVSGQATCSPANRSVRRVAMASSCWGGGGGGREKARVTRRCAQSRSSAVASST